MMLAACQQNINGPALSKRSALKRTSILIESAAKPLSKNFLTCGGVLHIVRPHKGGIRLLVSFAAPFEDMELIN